MLYIKCVDIYMFFFPTIESHFRAKFKKHCSRGKADPVGVMLILCVCVPLPLDQISSVWTSDIQASSCLTMKTVR